MVARTNVIARVRRPNSSPRSRFKRNTTTPMPTLRRPATTAEMGRVARNGSPNVAASVVVVYIPAPKNAPCPKLKYPA